MLSSLGFFHVPEFWAVPPRLEVSELEGSGTDLDDSHVLAVCSARRPGGVPLPRLKGSGWGAAEVKEPAGKVGPRACGGSHGGQGGTQSLRALLVGDLSQSGKVISRL